MPDLDQGGQFQETTRVYLGPSLGWRQGVAPPVGAQTVTTAGTTVVQAGISLIHVNVNGAVTVQLYAAKGNSTGGPGAVPGSWVQPVVTIHDSGGHAQAFPITILPAAGETIGGAAFVTLAANYALFTMIGDVQNGGWTVLSGTSGTALTDAPSDGTFYGRQSGAWANVAPLTSPGLLGTPTAPTAAALTNSTQLSTTAYADAAVGVEKTRAQAAEALLAPLASPALTGTPTAPTAAITTNSTQVATTAFVKALFSPITTSLGGDVAISGAIGTYVDGPSVAQGTSGTWFVSGFVTVSDPSAPARINCKLWDGATVVASGVGYIGTAGAYTTITLSGFIAAPAGNLRVSCSNSNFTDSVIRFNLSGNSKDSTITAIRIA